MKISPSRFSQSRLSGWQLHGVILYRQAPGEHPQPMTIPANYERVELVTAGRGWIRNGNEWREVGPGDLIWNACGDETIGRSDFKNPYQCLAVHLIVQKRQGTGQPRFSRWEDLDEVRAFASESVRLFWREDFPRDTLRDYLVSRLLFRVQVHQIETGHQELPEPLRAVLHRMETRLAEPCRLADLAAEAGWSVSHLHETFRRYLNASPHQILIRFRLRAAKERLASGNQPIKQIANECGFTDAAAFTNTFRASEGLTPGEYRKRHLRLMLGPPARAQARPADAGPR